MIRKPSLRHAVRTSLRNFSAFALSLAVIAGCGGPANEAAEDAASGTATTPMVDQPADGMPAATHDPALVAAVAGSHRTPARVERDKYRHPVEALEFFGIRPDMTVVEMWAEGGWWTEILAPYLHDEGTYYVADIPVPRFRQMITDRIESSPEIYGKVILTQFGGGRTDIAPEGSADMILTFRNLHNWLRAGDGELAFETMYKTLKPGGILGLVEHRGDPSKPQDPQALSGYVREDYVIEMAEKAGFELVDRSEMNANPKDTKDYPEGVWMLPPDHYMVDNDADRERYKAIGESDRMTLKFRKPAQ